MVSVNFFHNSIEIQVFQLCYPCITDSGLLATIQQYILKSLLIHPAPQLCSFSISLRNITVPSPLLDFLEIRKPIIPGQCRCQLTVRISLESNFLQFCYLLVTDERLLATPQQSMLNSLIYHPDPNLWVFSIFLRNTTVPRLLLELKYIRK